MEEALINYLNNRIIKHQKRMTDLKSGILVAQQPIAIAVAHCESKIQAYREIMVTVKTLNRYN